MLLKGITYAKGEIVTLRPVRESDLDALREMDLDLESRGDYWPRCDHV